MFLTQHSHTTHNSNDTPVVRGLSGLFGLDLMKQHSFLYFLSRFAAGDIREFLGLVTPDPPSMAPVMALTTSLTALRLMAALSPLSLERRKNQSFEICGTVRTCVILMVYNI